MSDAGGGLAWRTLVAEAAERLGDQGEARRLVAHVSGLSAAELVLRGDEPAGGRAVARFDALLARRAAGEPLQYVLGSWGFRRLDLLVDRRVLIPRPETEHVVELALAEAAALPRPLVAVDLGTGSGAIALSLAVELPGDVEVWAVDVSSDALAVARANLAGLGVAGGRVRIGQGDWWDALPGELAGRVGLAVANPPYVGDGEALPDEVGGWEPVAALRSGPDGLDAVRAVLAGAPRWLARPGVLVVEVGAGQGGAAAALARASGADAVAVRPDLAGRDRALIATFA